MHGWRLHCFSLSDLECMWAGCFGSAPQHVGAAVWLRPILLLLSPVFRSQRKQGQQWFGYSLDHLQYFPCFLIAQKLWGSTLSSSCEMWFSFTEMWSRKANGESPLVPGAQMLMEEGSQFSTPNIFTFGKFENKKFILNFLHKVYDGRFFCCLITILSH